MVVERLLLVALLGAERLVAAWSPPTLTSADGAEGRVLVEELWRLRRRSEGRPRREANGTGLASTEEAGLGASPDGCRWRSSLIYPTTAIDDATGEPNVLIEQVSGRSQPFLVVKCLEEEETEEGSGDVGCRRCTEVPRKAWVKGRRSKTQPWTQVRVRYPGACVCLPAH